MKSKNILKMISNVLLVLLVLPVQSQSKDLCFNETESKKLLVEIKYGQISNEKLEICQKQYSTSKQININNETIILNLEQNSKLLTELSEDFKRKYINTNTLLTKCEESKPSRFTWFSIGAGTAMIGSLVSILLISK